MMYGQTVHQSIHFCWFMENRKKIVSSLPVASPVFQALFPCVGETFRWQKRSFGNGGLAVRAHRGSGSSPVESYSKERGEDIQELLNLAAKLAE
jgi:hypothetical protein